MIGFAIVVGVLSWSALIYYCATDPLWRHR